MSGAQIDGGDGKRKVDKKHNALPSPYQRWFSSSDRMAYVLSIG